MILQCLLSGLLTATSVGPISITKGDDPKPKLEFGLNPGHKLPRNIVKFLNGEPKGTEGIPSVMIGNAKSRGIVVWSRGADDSAFALARRLDSKKDDGNRLASYLVLFDANQPELSTKAGEFKHVILGTARKSAASGLDAQGVEATAKVSVFLMDGLRIHKAWSFKSGDLTGDEIAKISEAASAFAAKNP